MMALSLADAAVWAVTPANVAKVTVAVQRAAVMVAQDVMSKNPPLPNIDVARIVFARRVFQQLGEAGQATAWAVAADQNIDPNTISDTDLVQRIYDMWP